MPENPQKEVLMTDKGCDPEVYEGNIAFWNRAWSMVKTPYTQLPPLPYIDRIVELMLPARQGQILDLGCGSGWLSIHLARNGSRVIGVDVSDHALELGAMWAAQENLTSIQFIKQDISNLQFPAATFSGVVANSIFEHLTWELAHRTVEQLEKITEPGGIFFGCFDRVGTGPGQYFKLDDGTQVYTDKGRQGMMLRCFSDDELRALFQNWTIEELTTIETGTRLLVARLSA